MPSRCETVSGPKLRVGTQTSTICGKGDAQLVTGHSVGTKMSSDMHELAAGHKAGVSSSRV